MGALQHQWRQVSACSEVLGAGRGGGEAEKLQTRVSEVSLASSHGPGAGSGGAGGRREGRQGAAVAALAPKLQPLQRPRSGPWVMRVTGLQHCPLCYYALAPRPSADCPCLPACRVEGKLNVVSMARCCLLRSAPCGAASGTLLLHAPALRPCGRACLLAAAHHRAQPRRRWLAQDISSVLLGS